MRVGDHFRHIDATDAAGETDRQVVDHPLKVDLAHTRTVFVGEKGADALAMLSSDSIPRVSTSLLAHHDALIEKRPHVMTYRRLTQSERQGGSAHQNAAVVGAEHELQYCAARGVGEHRKPSRRRRATHRSPSIRRYDRAMPSPQPAPDPRATPPLPRSAAEELARTLKAVADPTRLQLLSVVLDSDEGRATIGQIADALGLRQPTVTHHMQILVEDGLLERQRDGKFVWLSVTPARRRAIEDLLR